MMYSTNNYNKAMPLASKWNCLFYAKNNDQYIKINNVTDLELIFNHNELSQCEFSFDSTVEYIIENYENINESDIRVLKEREGNSMKYVEVKFGTNPKIYRYKTNLDLIVGGKYEIIADNRTSYNTPVTIVGYVTGFSFDELRTITSARIIEAPKRPDGNVKNIYINEDKKTVVVLWKDGTKTKVKCHPDDTFDAEKGIAMCYMKKQFNNRGCFNEVFKKYI